MNTFLKHLLYTVPMLIVLAPCGSVAQDSAQPDKAGPPAPSAKPGETLSSFDPPDAAKDKEQLAPGLLKFSEADLPQVLEIYQELSGRSVIRASSLPAVKISFRNQTALNRREALQALDTVLSQNGIVMIPLGTKYMKAVTAGQAPGEAVPLVELPREQLPESGSYMLYIVKVKNVHPTEAAAVLAPLSRTPNSIVAVGDRLLLRDYSTNVRRMLQVLDALEAAEGR